MTCQEARENFPLFLYSELSFDDEELLESHVDGCEACRSELVRERALHNALLAGELRPSSYMLARSRQELARRLAANPAQQSWWHKLRQGFTIHVHPIPAGMQPLGALALIAMGFFGARMLPQPSIGGNTQNASLTAPVTSRVRYVEPAQAGKVQVVIEETRERVLSGNVDDQNIQNLLLAAARDPQDAGLRVESVDLLKSSRECPEIRTALLYAVEHDSNPGVRLKALDGLKNSAGDAQVRQVLTRVLLSDGNAGVRTQAIDLLIQQKGDRIVGVLQELMRKEDNGYVRMRCQKALHEMNASVETY
jgi:HEAT repeats/Putative zinc-finger